MYGIDERWITTEQTVEKINLAIKSNEPFSLVRIGDGEYLFVENEKVSLRDLETIIWVHFGRQPFPDRYVKFIGDSIVKSAQNADIIGLFRGPLVLSEVDGALQRVLHGAIHRDMIGAGASIVNADIHNDLLTKRLYGEFLSNLPFLGIVTCRDLGSAISKHFGIPEVKTYLIPEQSQFVSDYSRFSSERPHFPDVFFELERSIKVPFPGAVFLVGAGVVGKAYCDIIKARGGIAIDIGSVFDAWEGVMSRSQFSNPLYNEIASELRLIDRREALEVSTNIESATWLKMDDQQSLGMHKSSPLDVRDRLCIERVSEKGALIANQAAVSAQGIKFSGRTELIDIVSRHPDGASIFHSGELAGLGPSGLQGCSTRGELCWVLNSLLDGQTLELMDPNVTGVVFASHDAAEALQLMEPDTPIIHPAMFKIEADPVDLWIYCEYEVTRPVPQYEFATATTIGFDDGKTNVTIRSGLNSISQAAIILGDEHAVSFVRYDFNSARRIKVLISFSERQMLVSSNGHLFQPRAIGARSGRPRKISIGSYINGAHVLGGRVHALGFGSGVIGKNEMISLTS